MVGTDAGAERLRSSARIREVIGARASAGSATVVVHSDPGVPGRTRAAVVAGRRVGTAVQRNRAKRRLRGALDQISLPTAVDLVVSARAQALDAPFPRLVADLSSSVRRSAARHGRMEDVVPQPSRGARVPTAPPGGLVGGAGDGQ